MSPSLLSSKPQAIPWERGDTQARFTAVCRTVPLSRGHSDSTFPGCYIILLPVSEMRRPPPWGRCSVGWDQGIRAYGAWEVWIPAFWRPQILLGFPSAPSPSSGVFPLVKGTPVPGAGGLCKHHTVESASLFAVRRGQPQSCTPDHSAVSLLTVTVSLEHSLERGLGTGHTQTDVTWSLPLQSPWSREG